LSEYAAFVGRRREARDTVTARDARRMAQVLDSPAPGDGDPLPPLWHWMGWAPESAHAAVAPDGHLMRGDFLPDTPQPRRMWAGGRLSWQGVLRVGEELSRETTITAVTAKQGSAGDMVFVTLSHRITGAEGHIDEAQDLVFVDLPKSWTAPAARPAPPDPDWTEDLTVDPVRLFRFSALTYNGHRIHYDHPYATGIEHYPGLVIHGPLQAMWLMDRWTRRNGKPAAYAFRGVRPAFAGPLRLAAWGGRLATVDAEGAQCMTAEVS
jgi:3-methylfumaryl-CoA hydratase